MQPSVRWKTSTGYSPFWLLALFRTHFCTEEGETSTANTQGEGKNSSRHFKLSRSHSQASHRSRTHPRTLDTKSTQKNAQAIAICRRYGLAGTRRSREQEKKKKRANSRNCVVKKPKDHNTHAADAAEAQCGGPKFGSCPRVGYEFSKAAK